MVSDGTYQVIITPGEPLRFNTYFEDYVKPLQHFFCFVMGQTVFPDDILGVKEGFQTYPTSRYLQKKGISRSSTSVRYSVDNRHLMRDKDPICYFYLSDVEDDIEQIFNDWFRFVEKHTPTAELFFDSIYYSEQPFPSITLLNLGRALEAYHRGSDSYTNRYIDKDDFEGYYEELVGTIRDGFPRPFRDHLEKGTFRFANRKSLRRRLKELFRDQEEHLETIYDGSVSVGQLVDDVVGLRNDLTHLTDESVRGLDDKSKEGHNTRLRILIELIIFDEVGMPRDGYFCRFK